MQNLATLHLFSVLKINLLNCSLFGEVFFAYICIILYFWATKNGNLLLWVFFFLFFFFPRRFFCSKVRTKGRKWANFPKSTTWDLTGIDLQNAGIPWKWKKCMEMEKKSLLAHSRVIINHSSCEMKLNNWKNKQSNINSNEGILHFFSFPVYVIIIIPACTASPTHHPQVFNLLPTKSINHQ